MSETASQAQPHGQRTGFFRLRPRLLAGLLVLGALGYGGQQLWEQYATTVSQHAQFRVSPEKIQISPPPPWIHADIRGEVLRDAGLVGSLSVLDVEGKLHDRIKSAFEFHPWVKSVERITKRLPAALEIELLYRVPVAAVESAGRHGAELLPVDVDGVRLPDADFSEAQRVHFPRIVGTFARPLVGQPWEDRRVMAGVRLAAGLAQVWTSLRLFEIVPVDRDAEARSASSSVAFEVITGGGTRVIWGAAPGDELPGESPFIVKLNRLQEYATEHGDLNSIDGPEEMDVRADLIIVPRTARRGDDTMANKESDVTPEQSTGSVEEESNHDTGELAAQQPDENKKR